MKGNAFAGVHFDPDNPFGSEGSVVAVGDISDVEEYSYGPAHPHLGEKDALALYRATVKSKATDSLVVLQDHDCGHWTVVEYKTPVEREGYLRSVLGRYVAHVFTRFRSR